MEPIFIRIIIYTTELDVKTTTYNIHLKQNWIETQPVPAKASLTKFF